MAFEVRGDVAQWRVVFERLATMDIGDEITDDELLALLPDASEGSVRSAYFRARRELQDQCSRSMDRVRGKGYRIVAAREHADLAKRQHKRAKRRIAAAQRETRSADRSRLTREERQWLDALELHLARMADNLKRIDERQTKTEERQALTEKELLALRDDQERTKALLRKHGISDEQADGEEAEEPLPAE